MKFCSFFILTLAYSCLHSQNPFSNLYKDLEDGKHLDTYSNGKNKVEWTIDEGQLSDEYISYYKNGKIMSKGFFKNGRMHGEFFDYNKQGKVIGKETYREDTLLEVSDYQYYKSGALKSTYQIIFSQDTNVASWLGKNSYSNLIKITYSIEQFAQNCSSTGIAIDYYEDGSIKARTPMVNGDYNGKAIAYFKNGQTASIANYKNNQFHGRHMTYSLDGNITLDEEYDNGKKIK